MAITFGKSSPDSAEEAEFRDEEEVKIVEDPEVAEGSEDPEAAEGKKVAKMREELSACRKDKQEYMDGWQRAKADYVNLLKRFEVEIKTAKVAGVVKAVETLLPAFDALERSKEHLPAGRQVVNSEGFLAIAKQLESAFASLGLQELGKGGEKFDPAYHEALGRDVAESIETDDTITTVLEKGWKIGDNVIRPAKVRVAHFAK